MGDALAHFEECSEQKIRRKPVEAREDHEPAEARETMDALALRLLRGSPKIVCHGRSLASSSWPGPEAEVSTGIAPARTWRAGTGPKYRLSQLTT